MEQRLEAEQMGEDTVQQVLLLAERLRESHGKELDDESIIAVAEATGASEEYVRRALANRPKEQNPTVTKQLRSTYLSLNPEERAWVAAAALGGGAGIAYALDHRFMRSNGLFGILMIILIIVGFYTVATRKDSRLASIAGAIMGCVGVIMSSVFGLLLGLNTTGTPMFVIPLTIGSAILGFGLQKLLSQNRQQFGLKDPAEERQELLKQLVDLQERLKTGEQSLTFLSVDMVGSSRMKMDHDPLSVEYTFNEYHKYVERATVKNGGTVHSTAGDGVTCAFEHPQAAFLAAKNIQLGLIDLNTFGNKLGTPIVLRCGIHSGTVVAPNARDVTSVNFAHVIDIAAHLQKVCPAGGIVVSRDAIMHVPPQFGVATTEEVESDGVTGYVWRPKTIAAQKVAGPPPAP